jgi:ATP-dependent RNA helicase DeaD
MNKFEQLGLSESLLKAILDLDLRIRPKYRRKRSLLLEKDRYGCVGSDREGKRQHLISVIQKIDANNRNTQALILSPTRELCLQITNEIKTTRNTKRY